MELMIHFLTVSESGHVIAPTMLQGRSLIDLQMQTYYSRELVPTQ